MARPHRIADDSGSETELLRLLGATAEELPPIEDAARFGASFDRYAGAR